MKKGKRLLTVIMSILLLSLAAPTNVPLIGTTYEVAAAVNLSSSVTLITGQSKQLKVPGAAKKTIWSSSNKNVALVTQRGKVTAKNKGSAIITAKVGKSSYKYKVTVQTPSISKRSLSIKKGSHSQLKVNGTNQKTTWKSSNKNIATVTATGIVTGKKAGSCKIYATVLGKLYTCNVTVSSTSQITMVWLSATGKKYHRIPNCGTMNPNKARQISLTEAVNRNYKPCKKCF